MALNVGEELRLATRGPFYMIREQQLYLANWDGVELTGKILSQAFDECTLLGFNRSIPGRDRNKLKISEIDLLELDPTLELTLGILCDQGLRERKNTVQLMSNIYGVPDDISDKLGDYKNRLVYDINKRSEEAHAFFRKGYFRLV